MNTIEIKTTLPLHEYNAVKDDLQEQLSEAGIEISINAGCIARTAAALSYHEWFSNHGQDWDAGFMYGTYADDWDLDCNPDDVNTDVTLWWFFPEEEASLAMMFKLAHGGR